MKRYLNTSMTYFSYLSEIGTIYQRLMLRTPLSSVSRGLAKALYTTGGEGGPGKEARGAEGSDGPDEQAGISGKDTQIH